MPTRLQKCMPSGVMHWTYYQRLKPHTMLTITLLSKHISALASSSAATRHNNAQKNKYLQVCHTSYILTAPCSWQGSASASTCMTDGKTRFVNH